MMPKIKTLLTKLNWKIIIGTIIVTVVLSFLALFTWASAIIIADFPSCPEVNVKVPVAGCNVAKIKLYGDLVAHKSRTCEDETILEDVYNLIEKAGDDSKIQAILLDVDSGGGSMVGGQEIAQALKRIDKPSVALIKRQGNSSAYWGATGATRIFASEFSDLGSIAIDASYMDESKKNAEEGYTYNQLTTGRFKDMYSLEKPLTQEERDITMKNLMGLHKSLVADIAKNRGLTHEDVDRYADGSVILPGVALEAGLIDEIGGIYEVKQYLAKTLSMNERDLVICNYGL